MYDLCTDHNSDQYIMTTKELQLLVGRTTKKYGVYGEDAGV
jgi:hypothetical protein